MFSTTAQRQNWLRRLLALEPEDDLAFNAAALELFDWQFTKNRAYRHFTQRQPGGAIRPRHWSGIPAAPQTLFKVAHVATHPLSQSKIRFYSSGTTGHARSQHSFTRLDLYQGVSVAGAKPLKSSLCQLPPLLCFLTPSPSEAPHSSLSKMFSFWKRHYGDSSAAFYLQKDQLAIDRLRSALETAVNQLRPVAILGPAFAYVPLLEAWKKHPLRLPRKSWLLETGGFKGRTREISKPQFYHQLTQLFGLSDSQIWNEYGMCELSSQAYAQGIEGLHHAPPWARVIVVDPVSQKQVKIGRRGLVRWIDLANVDSVLAVQTSDLAKRNAEGFSLIGRLPELPLRGCSLSAEETFST